jgi:hypothetical protein
MNDAHINHKPKIADVNQIKSLETVVSGKNCGNRATFSMQSDAEVKINNPGTGMPAAMLSM